MSCRIDLYTEFNFGIFIRYSILCCVVFLMNKASVEYSKTNFAFYVCTLFLFFIPCAPDAETWALLLSKTLFFLTIYHLLLEALVLYQARHSGTDSIFCSSVDKGKLR